MRQARLLGVTLILLLAAPAGAGEPWEDEEAFKALVTAEVKALRGLLKTALKKDYRRQAWYLADRILQVDPTDTKAVEVMDQWDGEALQLGQEPKTSFVKKRDKTLRALGDDYFHFGETLEASGMDPETYYPINLRAHAYGSRAGPLVAALEQAGYVWLGVYGAKERSEVEKLLGDSRAAFHFPQEYEDDYLRARCVWPAARGARAGTWRLLTDHDYKEALRLLGMLAACERWMVENLGSRAKRRDDDVVDVYVFSEWQAYDRIGEELVHPRERERFPNTSGWFDPWRKRLLVCWRHRENGFLGDDDLMLGHAAKVMARHHLAAGAGSRVRGKGYALLEGLRGAFEGFGLDADGRGSIDPAACWRLAAARTLREQGMLLGWEELLDLDADRGEALDRPSLKVGFLGSQRDAKRVDVAAAQATALVVGILKHDGGALHKRFAKLLGDLYKRDSLPDLDKALGMRMEKILALADVAMDAAHGRPVK